MDRPVPQPETLWRAAVFERRGNIQKNDHQRTEMNPQVRNLVEDELADNQCSQSVSGTLSAASGWFPNGATLAPPHIVPHIALRQLNYCLILFPSRVVRRVRNDFSRMELAEKLDADAA